LACVEAGAYYAAQDGEESEATELVTKSTLSRVTLNQSVAVSTYFSLGRPKVSHDPHNGGNYDCPNCRRVRLLKLLQYAALVTDQ